MLNTGTFWKNIRYFSNDLAVYCLSKSNPDTLAPDKSSCPESCQKVASGCRSTAKRLSDSGMPKWITIRPAVVPAFAGERHQPRYPTPSASYINLWLPRLCRWPILTRQRPGSWIPSGGDRGPGYLTTSLGAPQI
jgi:hypothetical protein